MVIDDTCDLCPYSCKTKHLCPYQKECQKHSQLPGDKEGFFCLIAGPPITPEEGNYGNMMQATVECGVCFALLVPVRAMLN